MSKYIKDIVIQCTETDKNKKFKAYAALCATQEAAQEHASLLHFGYDDLASKGSFWVLSRMKLRFNEQLYWRDLVTLSTWHKGSEGIFALRDFVFNKKEEPASAIVENAVPAITENSSSRMTENPSPAIVGTSSWLILDGQTHRILRPDSMIKDDYQTTVEGVDAIKEVCGKLVSPKDMDFVRTKEVAYSDVDMLGHTNNAKYLEWAFDCLDPNILYENNIYEVQINFNTETTIGNKIDLYIKEVNSISVENTYFIEGRRDDKNVFQLSLKIN